MNDPQVCAADCALSAALRAARRCLMPRACCSWVKRQRPNTSKARTLSNSQSVEHTQRRRAWVSSSAQEQRSATPAHSLSCCARSAPALQAPKIDITGVKPSVLLNVGLLTCTLWNGSAQIVEIKIMTQVTKKKDGSLARVMFDPLA